MTKPNAIIVDLDGTLCDIEHRRLKLRRDKNWVRFFEAMHQDTINPWCAKLVDLFHQENFKILIVTGRPEEYRDLTMKWLYEHVVPYRELFVRPSGDYTKDALVKKAIYLEQIHDHYEVLFVVDDRQQVVDMWREQGLVCLQCDKGDF